MGVLVGLDLSPEEFGLGQIIGHEGDVEVESIVPLGDNKTILLRIYGNTDDFSERLASQSTINDFRAIKESTGDAVLAMELKAVNDSFVECLRRADGIVLSATKRRNTDWSFEVLFDSAEKSSEFQAHCNQHEIGIDIRWIKEMGSTEPHSEFGLTKPQVEAFTIALDMGYYEIPRQISTGELGEQLGISDQAVTERLRRATKNLGKNTVCRAPKYRESQ